MLPSCHLRKMLNGQVTGMTLPSLLYWSWDEGWALETEEDPEEAPLPLSISFQVYS